MINLDFLYVLECFVKRFILLISPCKYIFLFLSVTRILDNQYFDGEHMNLTFERILRIILQVNINHSLSLNKKYENLILRHSRQRKLQETLLAVQQLDVSMANLRRWLSGMEHDLTAPIIYESCDQTDIQQKLRHQKVTYWNNWSIYANIWNVNWS